MGPKIEQKSWDQLLAESRLPLLESRALLEYVTARSRTWLIAYGDEKANQESIDLFRSLVHRRILGEPLAYILGFREFYDINFMVNSSVLIPRQETELLVKLVVKRAPQNAELIDLGTGSGVLAITIGKMRPDISVTGTDFSVSAIETAQKNLQNLGGSCRWLQGNWWAAVPQSEQFDFVVSNPPYIAAEDPHLDLGDLRYEPKDALVSGAEGLDALFEISDGAMRHLRPGGGLVLEHGIHQGPVLCAYLVKSGWSNIEKHRDAFGQFRAISAYTPN